MELRIGDLVTIDTWSPAGREEPDGGEVQILEYLTPGKIMLVTGISHVRMRQADGGLTNQYICYESTTGNSYHIGGRFLRAVNTPTAED